MGRRDGARVSTSPRVRSNRDPCDATIMTVCTCSCGVQRMVRSDLASSGVMFTIDPESGFRDILVRRKPGFAWHLHSGVRIVQYTYRTHFLHISNLLKSKCPIVLSILCKSCILLYSSKVPLRHRQVINGSWGLGESVVQGTVSPDEFRIFKGTLETAPRPVIGRRMGRRVKVEQRRCTVRVRSI